MTAGEAAGIGARVGGRYEIVGVLGEAGMGTPHTVRVNGSAGRNETVDVDL